MGLPDPPPGAKTKLLVKASPPAARRVRRRSRVNGRPPHACSHQKLLAWVCANGGVWQWSGPLSRFRNDGGGGCGAAPARRLSAGKSPAPFTVNVTKYRLFLSSRSVGSSMAWVHGPLASCSVIGLDGSTFRRQPVAPGASCRMSGKKRPGFGIRW